MCADRPEDSKPSHPKPLQDTTSQETVSLGPAGRESARVTGNSGAARSAFEQPGEAIGPYTLLSVLGEGGFGTVWLAERREPMVQRVALKIIKPGMDSAAIVARFQQERQALALMEHPNVSRVFDGGVTPGGRPYFVMEYVKGEPITAFCDRERMTIRQRLELFIPVCEAVQHAHTKGIIHRDLKPSNILVETIDGDPVVKVIDFGVAKAITQSEFAHTAFTQEGVVIGTPEYMSPEQVSGLADIDTRSDVYALGVVLYELLTGALPFDSAELRRAGLAEIQRVIREVTPPKPSTRLMNLGGDRTTTIAQSRSMSGDRLSAELRRELDWIPLMALRKERDRRYASAAALADDVCRYLDGRPLVAAPDSRMYLARKFVRRNKVQVGAVAAVFVALAAGLVVALWQRNEAVLARKAEAEQRERANERADAAERAEAAAVAARDAERQRADELKQVSLFQSRMLEQIDTTAAGIALMADLKERFEASLERAAINGDERAAQIDTLSLDLARINATDAAAAVIDRTILKPAIAAIDAQFKDQPVVDALLRHTLANVYESIGLYDAAMPLLESALAIRRRVLGDEHPDTLATLNDAGAMLFMRGQTAEAEDYLVRAREARARTLGPDHPDAIESLGNVGTLLRRQGKLAEAESHYRETLERYRRVLGDDHYDTLRSINNMGFILQERGDYAAAEILYREALDRQRRVLGEDHPLTLTSLNNISQVLRFQGKLAEAEPWAREAVERQERVLGEYHSNTLIALLNLGNLLYAQGKLDEAEPPTRRALEHCRRVLGNEHPHTLSALNNMGQLRLTQGNLEEAEALFREGAATTERVLGKMNAQTFTAKNNLGYVLQSAAKLSEAEPHMREAVELARALLGEHHPTTLIVSTNLAAVLVRQSKHTDALALLDPMEPVVREKFASTQPVRMAAALRIAGCARVGLGYDSERFALAEANLLEAHPIFVQVRGQAHKDTLECVQGLIDLYTAWHAAEPDKGYDTKAAEWQAKLDAASPPAAGETSSGTSGQAKSAK